MRVGPLDRVLRLISRLGRFRAWHRWPFPIAVPMIVGHRVVLRQRNLHDTQTVPPPVPPQTQPRDERTADGSYNDLAVPWMGMKGVRFGRNMPIGDCFGEKPPRLFDPSPRIVSNELLARRQFVPVPHLNVLAAAWIQFMVHDWLSHGSNRKDCEPWDVPLPPGDDWPGGRMTVLPTRLDTVHPEDSGRPPAFTNVETSWWDGSQIYGSDAKRLAKVRTDPATGQIDPNGKLPLPNGLLPIEDRTVRGKPIPNLELAGVNGNWWVGLSVLHTIFAREHNAIVDRLKIDYPEKPGEWLFQKARLVNAALMAKIHTVEWTPALMNSPEGRMAMRGNFWGVLGEQYNRAFGRVGSGEVFSGIPGSPADHHTAPYAMTEEFAASYRLHSLIPDDFSFRDLETDREILACTLTKVAGGEARLALEQVGFDNMVYSLATSHPGALVLHNFPNALRLLDRLAEDDAVMFDLASIDILRDRERGVPRYCGFRRRIDAHVPKTFAELTDNVEWQRELARVYDNDIEKVDLLVGTLAESSSKRYGTPPGFGFSDTAFRIFILMASRRLKSDRFFTDDFRPEVYTPAGFDWVQDNSLRTVMQRHCPVLRSNFADARNIFFPWSRAQV